MKLLTVPASRGVLWVRSGFRVFFSRPLAFAALFAAFLFGALLLLLVPGFGAVLLLASLPLVSQGFMLGTQRALAGRTPLADVFVEPLRSGREQAIAMLKIGLLYAVASFLIMWLSNLVDGGTFDALQEAMTATSPDQTPDQDRIEALLSDPRLSLGIAMRLALASLLALPFWHAPALIHWDNQGPAQSLFSSTVACWRNKGAFAVYGLTWAAVVMLFGILANTVFALLGMPKLVAAAAVPAGLMFSTVFYASLYFTFADCFEQRGDVAATPGDAQTP